MKNFIVKAFFNIQAENAEEAQDIACDMQEAANLVFNDFNRFLLIDETKPIEEGEVGIIVKD